MEKLLSKLEILHELGEEAARRSATEKSTIFWMTRELYKISMINFMSVESGQTDRVVTVTQRSSSLVTCSEVFT